MLMGAASADVPAIMVTGEPMLRGMYGTEPLGSGTDVWRCGKLYLEHVLQAHEGADFDFLRGGPGQDLEPYLPTSH